jgi:hypothetical protein
MKMKSLILFLMLITAAVVFTPAAYGQSAQAACSNATAAGTYSVVCNGWTWVGTTLLPIMQVAVATGDVFGNWTGTGTINIGGQQVITGAQVTGTSVTKPDCTGTVVYNKGTPSEMNIAAVTNPNTGQIFGLVTDKGTVMSCVLQRMASDKSAW